MLSVLMVVDGLDLPILTLRIIQGQSWRGRDTCASIWEGDQIF